MTFHIAEALIYFQAKLSDFNKKNQSSNPLLSALRKKERECIADTLLRYYWTEKIRKHL